MDEIRERIAKHQAEAARTKKMAAAEEVVSSVPEMPLKSKKLSEEAAKKLKELTFEFDPKEYETSLIGLLHPDAPKQDRYEPLMFDDPTIMFETFNPKLVSSKWQTEECRRVAGYYDPKSLKRHQPSPKDPFRYTLCAANGSGKDTYFIAPVAVWFCATKIRTRCIITGAQYNQLKSQTFANIKAYCETINEQLGEDIFDIVEFYIRCKKTGSEIRLFVTDDPGKAEGFHPFPDCPTNELMFIANEAKSIPDDMFGAFSRFTTSHWLNVSTPDTMSGFFHRSFNNSVIYPAPHIPDSERDMEKPDAKIGYARKITAFDCPHKSRAWIRAMERLHGIDSVEYRSGVLAEFTSIGDSIIISEESIRYAPPVWNTYGLPIRAGLDFSLSAGGDETVISIWHGNKRLAQYTIREEDGDKLLNWIIEKLTFHQVKPENVIADPGGLGILLVQRMRKLGWEVVTCRNEGRAINPKVYLNRVAENWFRLKRLIDEKILIIPREDTLFVSQLTSRKYKYKQGKTALESKTEAKLRGVPSPDRADACVLAFVGIPLSTFLGEDLKSLEEQEEHKKLVELNDHWKINALTPADHTKMQEIYASKRNEQLDERAKKLHAADKSPYTAPDKFVLTVNYKSHKAYGNGTPGNNGRFLNRGADKYRSVFNR